uniref:RNA-directed DNA polymerase n=2 Tax=Photinus pyralis TaxID=7054 RepID=A0A1Y1LFW6_PHOPY
MEDEGVDKTEVEVSVTLSVPINVEDLQKETAACRHLQRVRTYIEAAWPQRKRQISDDKAAEFFIHRDRLRIINGCIFLDERPVIPTSQQQKILEELHIGHPGATRMQSLAREKCFWPGINDQVTTFVKRCKQCAENAKSPIKEVLHPWPKPEAPWQRLHIDFAGPMEGDYFLVVVDAFSSWPEVIRMRSTTAEKTVKAMAEIFAHWGPCKTIVSDNGPQFISETFKKFCWGKAFSTSPQLLIIHSRTEGRKSSLTLSRRLCENLKGRMVASTLILGSS